MVERGPGISRPGPNVRQELCVPSLVFGSHVKQESVRAPDGGNNHVKVPLVSTDIYSNADISRAHGPEVRHGSSYGKGKCSMCSPPSCPRYLISIPPSCGRSDTWTSAML